MQKNKINKGKAIPEKVICTSAFGIYAPMLVLALESGEFMIYIVSMVCIIVCFGQSYIWVVFRQSTVFRQYLVIHQAALWCLSVLMSPALTIGVMLIPTFLLSRYAIRLADL